MHEQAPKKRTPDSAKEKHGKPDGTGPSGIAAAAVRGAMRSRRERGARAGADDPQVQQDDDQEWRRSGGEKSPE